MSQLSSLKKVIYTSLITLLIIAQPACKDLEKPAQAPFDLKTGTPGETEVKSDIPKNDRVHPLESNESIEFITDDGKAIVTHNRDRKLDKDDILIGNDEQKYLVRIKEVINKGDNKTEVILRQSRIGEVIGDNTGSVDIESTPIFFPKDLNKLNYQAKRDSKISKKKDKPSYKVDEKGKITIKNLELFSFELNNDGKVSGGLNKVMGVVVKDPYDKFALSGSTGGKYSATINEAVIEVVPTLRSSSKWKFGKIKQLETRFDTKIKYRVDITYDMAGQVSLEGLVDFLPKKVIPIKMGTPPVYVDIELGIPAGVKIKAEKSGKTRIVYETEYEFYSTMGFKGKEKIKTTKNQRVLINETKIKTTESSTKIDAELFLKPQVTARLYRVVGPYAYLKPYVRGEIEWPAQSKKDDLFVGVTGGVGIELSEPIFLNSIVSYDSGDIFNFYKSFDLDKKGTKHPPITYGEPDISDVKVDNIGNEGFVLINLKEKSGQDDLRFELVEPTKTGLIVPAEDFYFSGQLYYFPLSHSQAEIFKVKLIGDRGKKQVVDISLDVSSGVIAEASKDRFSMTGNSYKVTTGSIDSFAASVPSYAVPVGINAFQAVQPHTVKLTCSGQETLDRIEKYHIPCEELVRIGRIHSKAVKGHTFENKVMNLSNSNESSKFSYYNQYNFDDYLLFSFKNIAHCKPMIKTKVINKINDKTGKNSIIVRFVEETCGLIKPKINRDYVDSLSLFGLDQKDIKVESSRENGSFIYDLVISDEVIDNNYESMSSYVAPRSTESIFMYLPSGVDKNQVTFMSKTKLDNNKMSKDDFTAEMLKDYKIDLVHTNFAGEITESKTVYRGSYIMQNFTLEKEYTEDEKIILKIKNQSAEAHEVKDIPQETEEYRERSPYDV